MILFEYHLRLPLLHIFKWYTFLTMANKGIKQILENIFIYKNFSEFIKLFPSQ